MARARYTQNSFSRGQIDPVAYRREDTKLWRQALAQAENVVVTPVGALARRPGFVHCGKLRHNIAPHDMSAMTVSMPAGGAPQWLTDGDVATLTQTGALAAGQQVVVEIDAGQDVIVQAFDVLAYRVDAGKAERALRVQAQVNGTWMDFGHPLDVSTLQRHRRVALPPGESMTARHWRLVIDVPASGFGWLELGGIAMHGVGALPQAARLVDMTSESGNVYLLVLTDGHVDVHDANGNWLAAAPGAHAGSQLQQLTWAQKADTVLLFHHDVRPWRIQRQGADDQWQGDAVPLKNVPLERFPDETYTNAQACIQKVFALSPETNKSFTLTCEGTTTRPIQWTGTTADIAAAIKAALEDLPNVYPGITVVDGTENGLTVFTVTFTGTGNEGRDFLLMEGVFVDSATAFIEVEKTQVGRPGGEAVISDARGWPACGCFFQGRLLLGGPKSLHRALLMSRVGEYFDFDIDFEGAGGGIYDRIDMDDPEGIVALQPGRVLQIFCGTQVFYLDNDEIDREKPRRYIPAADIGAKPGARVAPLRGSTIYIGSSGSTLEEYVYSDVEASYGVSQIGYLWHEMMRGALDMDRRRNVRGEDADMLYLLRDDGSVVAFAGMREQNILGASVWKDASGQYRSLVTTEKDALFVVVARGGALYLQRAEADVLFDGVVRQQSSTPFDTVSGLDHLEGWLVWVLADGDVQGPLQVQGGQVALEAPARDVHVGLWIAPQVQTLPLRPAELTGAPSAPMRIHAVTVSLHETGSLAVGTGTDGPWPVSLQRMDMPADVPMMQRLFTGEARIDGLLGFDLAPVVRITQPRPGPLQVLGLDIEFVR